MGGDLIFLLLGPLFHISLEGNRRCLPEDGARKKRRKENKTSGHWGILCLFSGESGLGPLASIVVLAPVRLQGETEGHNGHVRTHARALESRTPQLSPQR